MTSMMYSAFNNNFVFNALTGYELRVGRNSLLAVDLKMVYAGGHRKLPVDDEQSISPVCFNVRQRTLHE